VKNFPINWFVNIVESIYLGEKWMSNHLRLGDFSTIARSGLIFSQNRTWSKQSFSIDVIFTSPSYIDLFSKFVIDMDKFYSLHTQQKHLK
jgi:hypothetical protein